MRVIGHRGTPVHPTYPENTLAAVRSALQAGADGVQVDVRATEDDVLVLSHDRDLGRVLGTGAGTGPGVAGAPLAELGSLHLPGGTGVPTLTEVLDLAAVHGAHVVTEVKPEVGGPDARRTARLLAALLAHRRRRRPGADRVTTTSFDLATAASLAGCGTVSGALIVAPEVDPDQAALRARGAGADRRPPARHPRAGRPRRGAPHARPWPPGRRGHRRRPGRGRGDGRPRRRPALHRRPGRPGRARVGSTSAAASAAAG